MWLAPGIVPGSSSTTLREQGRVSTRAAAAPDRRWDYGIVLGLVTPERMASYLGASQGDVERAFARYEWNIEASAGVMGLSSVVEVVVRNAIDRRSEERRVGSGW